MSSRKGFGYERETCRKLSCWWTSDPDYDDVVFWRTSGSGARATARAKKKKKSTSQHGDVTFVDPIGKPLIDLFCVEIKRGYNRSTAHDLIDRPGSAREQPENSYAEWIAKLLFKCDTLGVPFWMLIHKRDRREEMVWLPDEAVRAMPAMSALNRKAPSVCFFVVKIDGLRVAVWGYPFGWFLKSVPPSHIKALHRGR